MKKGLKYVLFASLLMMTSCKEDGSISDGGWAFILGIILIFIWVMYTTNNEMKKNNEIAKKNGDDPRNYKDVGAYIGGHPQINNSYQHVLAKKNGDVIEFWSGFLYDENSFSSSMPSKIEGFSISIDAIEDIRLEDRTTIDKNVTAGRMFLVGMYAFAWKKKKKEEMACVVIKWKMGKFENETIFMLEGKGAMGRANKARTNLINMCQ